MIPNQGSFLAFAQGMLSIERYEHTLRVLDQALLLASHHPCSETEVVMAACLHDCAKDLPLDVQLKQAETFGIVLADVERQTPALLHALVGAEIARQECHINNESVLSAIRWHTTGRPGMNTLEKVIFLADYTEPGRDFPGVTDVRESALVNLDAAMLLALNQTITYVLRRGWLLHPISVEARNYFLLQSGRQPARDV